MKRYDRAMFEAHYSGDAKAFMNVSAEAVQEYADRIALVIGPLTELEQAAVVAALRIITAAYESDMDDEHKKLADTIKQAVTVKFKRLEFDPPKQI